MAKGRRSRALATGLVLASALAAAMACSSFSEDDVPPANDDAGGDAQAPPAQDASADAPTVDTGTLEGPATPGIAECPGAGTTCDVKGSATCCYQFDAGLGSGVDGGIGLCKTTSCNFGDVSIHCDDTADCAPGERCCVTAFFASSSCVGADARCNEDQLCRTSAECPAGESCLALPCRGRIVGVCGAPTQYLADFCAGK